MAIRPPQSRPSAVPLPIALLPVVAGVDLVARLTGSARLRAGADYLAPLAASAATVAVVRQLLTPGRVTTNGRGHARVADWPVDLAVAGAVTGLASRRWRRDTPRAAYLGLGLAAVGLLSYSAYLASRRETIAPVESPPAAPAAAKQPTRVSGVRQGSFAAAVRTAAGDMLRGLP